MRKKVAAGLRPTYNAATVAAAELALDEFAAQWDATYPAISQIWRRNWERIIPFFAFPAEIRKVIYYVVVSILPGGATPKRACLPSADFL